MVPFQRLTRWELASRGEVTRWTRSDRRTGAGNGHSHVKHEIHHRRRTALRRDERTVARLGQRHYQARVDSEIPSWCAFTAVAPIVRFNAFEIFVTPTFFLASDFISRSSDEVHARRIAFFLVGILSSLFRGARLLSHEI
jgi:hypothetical protein